MTFSANPLGRLSSKIPQILIIQFQKSNDNIKPSVRNSISYSSSTLTVSKSENRYFALSGKMLLASSVVAVKHNIISESSSNSINNSKQVKQQNAPNNKYKTVQLSNECLHKYVLIAYGKQINNIRASEIN